MCAEKRKPHAFRFKHRSSVKLEIILYWSFSLTRHLQNLRRQVITVSEPGLKESKGPLLHFSGLDVLYGWVGSQIIQIKIRLKK